ncbi:NACHT_N domain-containing protein [Caenorhabditis elegans]|uniref:NACHT_N domain-containing protein n=1 Tax=Caenorhabditis elegans TaxID=6239 RepID=Q9U2B1_CAEEL|nr:NACHT_N domain-containing protein [Caenorhabditis elegans]CAB63370.1 NACHT_N domain-containing protein [Caenorhabditis elegans]|eukprot:NP_493015.1 Uncharacterized protein CELE_Y47H9C.8 [Caenorhabditis elegans]
MNRKRSKEDVGGFNDLPAKRPGTSQNSIRAALEEKLERSPIEDLELQLEQPEINVEEVGRIIADGIIEKTLDDEKLKELTLKFAKNVPTMANISIWNLSEELSTGTIDSRLVVIGNAFLWNLLKTSMSSIREKFENYKFKIHTMSATSSSLQSIDFSSSRIRAGEHCIQETEIFRKMDLLEIYNSVVFRKSGDLNGKSKQIIKNYFAVACQPKCAIWHYSLRQSGTSHKKWLQDIPPHVVHTLLHFLICLAGLGAPELDQTFEEATDSSDYVESLGDTNGAREVAFETLKSTREQLCSKFRQCVTDALNEAREMPYNTVTRELMAPPRGKPVDMHHCVTWRQYESLIRRCDTNPSKENLEAKQDLDFKLMFTIYQPRADDEEAEIDVKN